MECKFWLLAITLSSLYAATRTDHLSDMLAAENACMVKFPSITPATLNELKEVRDFPKFQASHPDLNCFVFCVGQELKMVDENGVLHIENLKNFTVELSYQAMSHDDAHKVVTACAESSAHEDHCERAGQYIVCKMDQMKDITLQVTKHDA